MGLSYATAEGELSKESDGRRKSMVFSERKNNIKISLRKGLSKQRTSSTPNLRGILKSAHYIKSFQLTTDSDSQTSCFDSAPNEPTGGIPSIKATLLSDAKSDPDSISDFAKSLASTLDSQMNHFKSSQTQTPVGNMENENLKVDNDSASPPSAARQSVTAPATPTGRMTPKRGIQFSPRLEVRETWHSAEYDRRGESATCNRLTPQLAQMIKEELNAYKMEEMAVHVVGFLVLCRWLMSVGKSIFYALLLISFVGYRVLRNIHGQSIGSCYW